VKRLAVGDLFVEHGTQKILRRKYGLDAQGILENALALLGHPNGKKNVVFGNF
jgi:1-deoxy-D-xylulose-5-phosphate synthase